MLFQVGMEITLCEARRIPPVHLRKEVQAPPFDKLLYSLINEEAS